MAVDSLNSIISGVAKGTLTGAGVRCLYKWNFISSDDANLDGISFVRRRVVNDYRQKEKSIYHKRFSLLTFSLFVLLGDDW